MVTAGVRVLVVEDDELTRESVGALLSAPEFRVVLSSGSVSDTMRAVVAGLGFDVALVDVGLPDGSGVDLLLELRRHAPAAELIVFSVHEDEDTLLSAFRNGATGYVLKGSGPEELVEAVRESLNGGAPMSPRVARRVVRALRETPPDNPLSPRETEVLQLLTRGSTYGEIAGTLKLSLSTVQTHLKSIYRKLDVSNKAEATAEALRRSITH